MKAKWFEFWAQFPELERRINRMLMVIALALPMAIVILAAVWWFWLGGGG
jgi:hypothetical protein